MYNITFPRADFPSLATKPGPFKLAANQQSWTYSGRNNSPASGQKDTDDRRKAYLRHAITQHDVKREQIKNRGFDKSCSDDGFDAFLEEIGGPEKIPFPYITLFPLPAETNTKDKADACEQKHVEKQRKLRTTFLLNSSRRIYISAEDRQRDER